MKQHNWKDTAELIGIAAVVVSLIFVGAQIRQDKDVARATLFAEWDDTQIEWARLIGENKDVWARGLKKEDLSDPDRAAFNVIASSYFDKEGARYRSTSILSGAPASFIIVKNADIIYSYPGLSAAWQDYAKFHRSHQHGEWLVGYWNGLDASMEEIRSGKREHTEPPAFGPN